MRCLCWQIADSVSPSSRAGSGRRRHSQAAPSTADTRNAQRICSANREQRDESVPPSSRAGSGRRRHSQAASMRQCAAPDHGQRDESVTPSSRAGSGRRRHSQAAANATNAAPDHGQRDESVSPSSRTQAMVNAGVHKPQPIRAGARNAAHLLGKLRPAQRWRAPIEPRTAAVDADRRKPQSMRQAPRQITDSAATTRPHRAAQAAVDAGIHKPQSMRQAPQQIADSATKV